ncbi:MAG: arginase family protein [Rhodospirillales bacterium]
MSDNKYYSGRLDLPFVGHCTFAKQPAVLDLISLDADVCVLGAPFDMGTQYRPGARFSPRAIREASTLFSFGHGGMYDFEDDVTYLPQDGIKIVDIGDADMIHTDTIKLHKKYRICRSKNSRSGRDACDTWWRSLGAYSVH